MRSSHVRGVVGLAIAAAMVAFLAAPADAQSRRDQQRARTLYGEAQALFERENYAAAESSFRAAYQAVPNPVVLRAVATAQERQGNISGAIETLQQYLRESPDASDRAEVEAQIQEWSRRPATLTVDSAPEGASIFVDGADTGQRTPSQLQVPGGERTIELRLAGYETYSQTFNAIAGASMRIEPTLREASGGEDVFGAEGGDGRAAEPGTGVSGGGSSDPSAAVWVTAGIAGAGIISGTIFGFLALSEQSNFDAQPSFEAADRGETFALVADISFAVGAAAAITAIILYIVEQESSAGDVAVSEGDTRVDVAPWADPTGAGLAARVIY